MSRFGRREFIINVLCVILLLCKYIQAREMALSYVYNNKSSDLMMTMILKRLATTNDVSLKFGESAYEVYRLAE